MEPRYVEQRLVRLPRQRRGRQSGAAMDLDRPGRQLAAHRRSDGLFALETEGERRRTPKLFFRCPVGAELCGPCFTPDGETVFVAVQHPAADGSEALIGFGRASTFKDPATRWPDFDPTCRLVLP